MALGVIVMDRSTSTIAGEIAAFQPSGDNWRPLDALINELWSVGEPAQAIPQLLKVFEHYPSEDGAGVFWAIVRGLESLPNYEPYLVESFSRVPSEFAVTMLCRLANAGTTSVSGHSTAELIRGVVLSESAPPSARSIAAAFLSRTGSSQ